MKPTTTIGITDCSKWINYAKWVQVSDVNVNTVKLSWENNSGDELRRCDGIILTGGEDVHPKFYNKNEYLSLLNPKDVNEQRDEFELKIIDAALSKKTPILGICRGLQIANVYFKGTLILDMPSIGIKGHAKAQGYDQTHHVKVLNNSVLYNIVENEQGVVNSAHHQAADLVGKELKITASSEDQIAEALEWKNPENKSFLLLVQWHPERMKETSSPFCRNVRDKFLEICTIHNMKNNAV